MDEIQMAQVGAAEKMVVDGLRKKGLLPPEPPHHGTPHPAEMGIMVVCDPCGSIVKASWVIREEDPKQAILCVDKCGCDSPLVPKGPSPFTGEQHHELCLGIMARCYPFVGEDLRRAIREGIESASLLGFPVSAKNLEKGGPIFNGGHA